MRLFLPRIALAAATVLGLGSSALGQIYINEIFFNPPNPTGGDDQSQEYIEIRGSANGSLANKFLIAVQGNAQGNVGQVEAVFNLSDYSFGSNGFLALRQVGSPYTVHPDSAVVTSLATNWEGLGTFVDTDKLLKSDSLTYFLIDANPNVPNAVAPSPFLDVDQFQEPNSDNDGLDYDILIDWGWTILDGISVMDGDVGDRAYARTVFYDQRLGGQPAFIEPNAIQVGFNFGEGEAEYLARWGNSTGISPNDWVIGDLTSPSNPPSGRFNIGESTKAPFTNGLSAISTLGTTNLVPEPGCAAVLGFSALGLALRRRRQ